MSPLPGESRCTSVPCRWCPATRFPHPRHFHGTVRQLHSFKGSANAASLSQGRGNRRSPAESPGQVPRGRWREGQRGGGCGSGEGVAVLRGHSWESHGCPVCQAPPVAHSPGGEAKAAGEVTCPRSHQANKEQTCQTRRLKDAEVPQPRTKADAKPAGAQSHGVGLEGFLEAESLTTARGWMRLVRFYPVSSKPLIQESARPPPAWPAPRGETQTLGPLVRDQGCQPVLGSR